MTLPNLFSRRKRNATKPSEVYVYDEMPQKLRVQIAHILNEAIPDDYNRNGRNLFESICRILRKEFGVFILAKKSTVDPREEFVNWLLSEEDIEKIIDGIEVSFRLIDKYVRENQYHFRDSESTPDEAIAELNARLLEAGVGYQYADGMILRADSQLMHAEVVVPVLQLLSDPRFSAVDEEFREAHAHFREGDHETCLVDCSKAFESCLKVIGTERGWPIQPTDSASKLLGAAFSTGFIPGYLQAEFTALKSLLESGVPTLRNKQGGHGAGTSPRVVPQELAAFQLHQTAAVLLFLVSHHRALK